MARRTKTEGQLALLDVAARIADDEFDVGYTARLFAQTSLPYKDPGDLPAWARRNGDLTLVVRPGMRLDEDGRLSSIGYPYGIWPRLLLTYLCTEAVRTQNPTLRLGTSMIDFMRALQGGRALSTGGRNGSRARLREQMIRLFNADLTIRRERKTSVVLTDTTTKPVIAEHLEQHGAHINVASAWQVHWVTKHHGGGQDVFNKESVVHLSQQLFAEITEHPVPLDINALHALSGSPMRLDIYTWLIHRISYLKRAVTIPWTSLQEQLGTGLADTRQGRSQFKKNFSEHLRHVLLVYPDARVEITDSGIVMRPSKTHVPMRGLRALTAEARKAQ